MKSMTAEQLHQLLESGEYITIIDVREDFEVAYGMIPGAIHIPLGELQYRMSELDERIPYAFVCKAGVRSYNAAIYMENVGFDTTNISDGMYGWQGDVEIPEVK